MFICYQAADAYVLYASDCKACHTSPKLILIGLFASFQALSYLDEDFLMQLEGFYLDKAHEVKLPIHLNMAACQIATGDYRTAVHNCSEV